MRTFFLIIFATVIFSACKKDDDPVAPLDIKFTSRALEYVQLPVSRYYIYKDSVTSELDSVVVTKSDLKSVFYPQANPSGWYLVPAHNQQQFELNLTQFIGNNRTDWLIGKAYAWVPIPAHSTDSSELELKEQDNTTLFSFFHSTQPAITMTVEGQTYNNVHLSTSSFGGDINDTYFKDTKYWWAKGVGIIKREVITYQGATKTQTLLRYN